MTTNLIGAGDTGNKLSNGIGPVVWTRNERATTLITLGVAKDTNPYSVSKQLNRECNTALNIKDSDTRKKVLKALNKLIPEVSKIPIGNGYIAYASFDELWIYRPINGVHKSSYICDKRYHPFIESQLISGKLYLSIKEAKIVMFYSDGHEELKETVTSGIASQHKKGGSSSRRFSRKHDEEINFFFRKVKAKLTKYNINFTIEGEKTTVKRFEDIKI